MKGKQVYITEKEMELLYDILSNDVNFSSIDERIEEKEELIDKLLKEKK